MRTIDTEQGLLECAARLIGFEYLMYVPETYPHKGGLLYRNASGRLRVWNPRLNDADLLQLAVARPTVNLHDLITKASQVDSDDVSRLAYLRETFLQAIVQQYAAKTENAQVTENAPSLPP